MFLMDGAKVGYIFAPLFFISTSNFPLSMVVLNYFPKSNGVYPVPFCFGYLMSQQPTYQIIPILDRLTL